MALLHLRQSEKVKADGLEQAILEQLFDRVLTAEYLGQLLEEVRRSYGIQQLEKELVEARATLEELERAIGGLVDAIEQRSSSALMTRLADRERDRDETLARVAALEIRRKRYTDAQLTPEDLEVLIEMLRRGLRSDRSTVSATLRRVVTKIEVQKEGGTLYVSVPCAVLSVGTPGATRTPAHGSGGHCSIH
jgi:hypothetical protein